MLARYLDRSSESFLKLISNFNAGFLNLLIFQYTIKQLEVRHKRRQNAIDSAYRKQFEFLSEHASS